MNAVAAAALAGSAHDRRRRAVDALGLGPLWVLRTAGADPTPSADARVAAIATMDRDALDAAISGCQACALGATRTRAVVGSGADAPDWLVVGDAPGADEDLTGDAFVGPGGRLLDAMLAAAGVSRRRNAFLAGMVRCRPPDDRAPTAEELATCRPYLERQVVLMAPRLVVAVGRVAARALPADGGPVERGAALPRVLSIAGRDYPVVATHPPEHLLKTPEDKAGAWADLVAARTLCEPG